MRLVGRGHEAIRATHHKTLEFAAGPDLTERGTCIVAVGTTGAAGPPRPLAGAVRVTITAGAESFGFDAEANSAWDPAGSAVVRRGPLRLPGTFAINSAAAAADLPPALVAALREPARAVEISVEPRQGPPTVVLFAADPAAPPGPRLVAELGAADAVIAEDAAARQLVAAVPHDARVVRPGDQLPGGRVLIVATADLPGRSAELGGQRLETVGLSAPLAAAATLPAGTPITIHPTGQLAELRRAPGAHGLVFGVERRSLAAFLAAAREERGTHTAVVVQDLADPVAVDTAAVSPAFPGAERLWCALGPAAQDRLDPAVRAVVAGLIADGTATKPAARALATLTGWPQRRAYDAVVALGR